MESHKDASEICEFYKDKHVLLTGGTGMLGKLLFHRLKKEDPIFMERLKIVPGDVSEPGHGLSSADVEHLIEKVQVVFHTAATVKFDEPLSTATKINSVVHVSTAYSHSPRKEIREEFYQTPISPQGLIALDDNLSPQLLNVITPQIMGEWINTYVFTKAVAEEAVRENVLTTRSEPIPNWIAHIHGPIIILVGYYVGAACVLKFNNNDKGELVPADMTVNCLLAVGYETAKSRKLQEIPIYNFTSHPQNPLLWADMFRFNEERIMEIPYSQTYWHYSSKFIFKNNFLYYLLAFFLQILPAVIIDLGLIFLHKKPRFLKKYNKIHYSMHLLEYFTTQTWIFSLENTMGLWRSLNDEDKKLFDFNMESLDFKSFLKGTIDGIRIYLKDEEKDLTCTKRRYFIPVFTYGSETWDNSSAEEKEILEQ
ncbi:unnamed protein product, partial [Nezara viridula]